MLMGGGGVGPETSAPPAQRAGLTTGAVIRDLLMAALIGTVGWSATEFQGMRVALVEVKTTMRNYDALSSKVDDHGRDIAVLKSQVEALRAVRP